MPPSIQSQELTLDVLSIESQMIAEPKSLIFNIFCRAEINAWRSKVTTEGFGPLSYIDRLPHLHSRYTRQPSQAVVTTTIRISLDCHYISHTPTHTGPPYSLSAKLLTDLDAVITSLHHKTFIHIAFAIPTQTQTSLYTFTLESH